MALTEAKKNDVTTVETANNTDGNIDSAEGIAYALSGAKEFYDRYPTYGSNSTTIPYYPSIN